jgi:hypothetical protein
VAVENAKRIPGFGVNVVLDVGGVLVGAVFVVPVVGAVVAVVVAVVVELLVGAVVDAAVVVELLAGAVVVLPVGLELVVGTAVVLTVVVELLVGAVAVVPVVVELLVVVAAVPVLGALALDELVEAAPLAEVSEESPHADSKPIRTRAETQRSAFVCLIRHKDIRATSNCFLDKAASF